MKKTIRIRVNRFILLLILTMAPLLTGCWDYREIDEQIIVSGVAVDYDKENKGILLTAEMAVPNSSGKESIFNAKVYQGKGKNLLDAAVDLRSKAGHTLLWSHAKVLIFSKELLAKENLLIGIMDWIKRNHEMRETVWLLLSQEKTAGEILTKANSQTEKIISYYLDHLLLIPKSETFLRVPYWKFVNGLQSVCACAALPAVRLDDSGNEKLPFLDGTELLNRTKPVGWLDGKQTRILLMLMNNLNQAVFAPEQADKEKLQAVSLIIINCQTAIEPVILQKGLIMKIIIKMEAEIGEIDGEKDVFKPDKIKKLAGGAQSVIKDKIKELLYLLQESYQNDVIGFGTKVENKYPKVWQQIKKNWQNEYPKIPVDIHVKINIPGSEQSMKVTKVGQ